MPPLSHPLRLLHVAVAGWIHQQERDVIDYLQEENRVLREQLGPRRMRFTDDQRVRLAAKAKTLRRHMLVEIRTLVTPDTLLAWHRKLIAQKYDGGPHRGPGRPHVMAHIRQLVVRMATENRMWGYTRIQGALANLDHQVARGIIANILKRHGIEPAPERQKRTTWQEFLHSHWNVLAATDFFTVEVWTGGRLTRFAVLFVIDLATRRVEIAGLVSEPDSAGVEQCGRHITDAVDGCLRGKRCLLHDRDPLFTDAFRATLAASGVQTLVGEDSLRCTVREFVAHYHHERNHQGMDNQLLFPSTTPRRDTPIACRQRLGGLLRYYHRPAA